jgi:hypothetical protein
MNLFRTRTQEERDKIVSNFKDTISLENILTNDDIAELLELYKTRSNKIHKNTGPVTSELRDDFKNIPVLTKIFEKIKEEIGECKIYTAFFFDVTNPHIIHNDDDKLGPLTYKGITIPLQIEYEEGHDEGQHPYLCFFDQYYLEGPSKFFGGSPREIESYYNKPIYEYSQVQNKSAEPLSRDIFNKYLTHCQYFWFNGLSFQSAQPWIPGNVIVFDAVRLHCASNFKTQKIKRKIGISMFTYLGDMPKDQVYVKQ